MADDTNNSGKGPMNKVGNTDIDKIGQRVYQQPLREREIRNRAMNAQNQIDALKDIPQSMIDESNAMSKAQRTAPDILNSSQNRIRSSVESRMERGANLAINQIGRSYSEAAINGQIRRYQETPDYQNRALGMQGQSYTDLAARHEQINGQIAGLGTQSQTLAGDLFSGRGVRKDIRAQLNQNSAQAGDLTGEMASINLAMKAMRTQGKDPLSKYSTLNESYASAQGINSAKGLGEELRSGGIKLNRGGVEGAETVSRGNIGQAIGSEAEKLAKIFEELSKVSADNVEKQKELRKAAEETAGNFEKLKAAGGMPSGPSKSDYLNAGGQMFGAIGNGIQAIGVNQRLGQVSNIQGYAGLENQKYDMYKSGRGGDVMSQMLAGSINRGNKFGNSLYGWQQGANSAQVAGSAMQAGAGIATGIEAAGQKFNPVAYVAGSSTQNSQNLLNATVNATTGAVNTATQGMDIYRGVSAGAADIAGRSTNLEASRAILKVRAEQLQGVRDFSTGMAGAAQGMGGDRGEKFLQNSLSDGMMDKMIDSRMSPEQVAQMSQQGVASMGSTFKSNQVFAARGLERTGNGSMQENMGRMASLAGAGANNPQAALGSVLEASFTKGLDSSKAITAMVENTAAMVAAAGASTAAGINTAASSSSLLAGNLDPNSKNQEFSVQRAMTAMEVTKSITNDTSTSFAGQINTARMSKMTGLDGTSSIYATRITTAELKTMQGMSEPNRKAALIGKGVDYHESSQSTKDIIKHALQAQVYQMTTVGGGALGLGNNTVREANAAAALAGKGYKDLNEKGQLLSSRQGSNTGLTGQEIFRAAEAITHSQDSPNSKKSVNAAMKGEGGGSMMTDLDNQRTSGMKQMAEAAKQATKEFGGIAKTLKTLSGMSKEFEKLGAGGAEAKFQDAAGESAATFGKATGVFDKAVDRFAGIMNKAGLGEQSATDKAREKAAMGDLSSAEKNQKKGRVSNHK